MAACSPNFSPTLLFEARFWEERRCRLDNMDKMVPVQLPSTFHIKHSPETTVFSGMKPHSYWDHGCLSWGAKKGEGIGIMGVYGWRTGRPSSVNHNAWQTLRKWTDSSVLGALKTILWSNYQQVCRGRTVQTQTHHYHSINQPINQYYLTVSRVVFYKFGKQRIQLFHSATCPDPRYVQPGTRNVFPIEVALFRLTRSPLEKSSNHPRSRSRSKARMNHRSDSDCELLKPLLSLVAIFEGFIMVLSWFYL